MRQVREVLRLKWECDFSDRKTARSCRISRPAVAEYVRRATAAGLTWPLPADLDDAALEARLFLPVAVCVDPCPLPDCAAIHRELDHQGVTLMLLWEEYKAIHPAGLQYSQFCERYRAYARTLDLSMRQRHRAGEKCFVDYAGQTVPVIDRTTGEARAAQIFVAVLGASNYTYCEASWTQQLPDWIGAHVRAFEYFQGVPELLIPDNLRSAVTRAHRYEPLCNASYAEMAAHYGTAILPARVRRPRDKAKAEVGVQVVERWILARLRHQAFFSLAELNQAIAALRERLNARAFRQLPGNRRERFETLDRPALKPLPAARYVFAAWKRARVHIDYHIEIAGHYYSVPYQWVGKQVEVRVTAHTVEAFHRGKRLASHVRSAARGRHTTVGEHMPRAHREYAAWTPTRLVAWAEQTGPATAALIEHIMAARALRFHAPDRSPQRARPRLLPVTLTRRGDTVMLHHPTLEKLNTLRLPGMAKALAQQSESAEIAALGFEERLGLLLDKESTYRDSKRLTTRLRLAALRQLSTCRTTGSATLTSLKLFLADARRGIASASVHWRWLKIQHYKTYS